MLKAKIIDGEHIEFADEKTLQDKIISNTQFINLVNFKKSQIEKEKEKLKVDLQLNSDLFKGKKYKKIKKKLIIKNGWFRNSKKTR